MRLEKLTLFGFKSFADRTDLAFEPGVTAIVGPNGCGKSNVADAIRWALGEQSARQLRGDRMDDVIFAGNAKRKPLGFAEVSLTLTGSNGHLSTPYEDVNVTRRLFRSGESEYLLNRGQCRLRDITELFLDTGLGGEPYALIEQGTIGSIVNARPLDRRLFIEEAAGIMKYKVKKRTAVHKLESASQNLTRVQDIIRELERQRGSLKRQASKAERYRSLESRAAELKIALKAVERRQLAAEILSLAAAETPLRGDLEGLRARIAAAEADLQRLRLQAVAQEQAVAEAQEALFALRNRLERDEGELRTMDQELLDLGRREGEGTERAAALARRIVEAEAAARVAGDRLAALAAEAAAHEAALAELVAAVEAMEAEHAAGLAALHEARAAAFQAAAEVSVRGSRLATLKERRRLLEVQAARMAEQLAGVREERSAADALLQDHAARAEGLAARRAALAGDLDAARRRAAEAETALAAAAGGVVTAREALERLRARRESLAELERGLEGYDAGHRYLLETRASEPSLSAILGPLSDLLDPVAGYERAIEALLGAHLQALCVPGPAAAGRILEALSAADAGRATLVAASLPWNGAGGWTEAAGANRRTCFAGLGEPMRSRVHGLARDFVAPLGGEELVGRLLGDGVVVADLETALALAPQLAHPFAIATLRGEVVDYRGTLTGGPAGAGILVRRREARDLAQHVAEAERTLAAAEDRQARLQGEQRAVAEEVARLDGALRSLDLEALGVEKDLEQHRSVASRLGQQLDLFGFELGELQAETARLGAEVGDVQEGLAAAEAAAEAARARAADAQRDVERVQGAREGLAAQVADRRVAASAAATRAEAEERAGAAARNEAAHLASERDGVEADVQAARARRAVLMEAQTALRGALQEAAAQERALGAALVQARETRADSQAREEALEAEVRQARSAESERARSLGALEVKRAEVGTALDLLDAALGEEHHLTPADLARLEEAGLPADIEAVRVELDEVRQRLAEMGAVNLAALEEYAVLNQRYEFLTKQSDDLVRSVDSLKATIAEINKTITARFHETLQAVNGHFDAYWKRLFGGGHAELRLVPVEGQEEAGVEMYLRIPGKRSVTLSLLSGGERALAALALLLALFAVRPSPFCVLDEVDAPLDDANVERFANLLREMAATTQIIVITHNKRTMEAADVLYGITMEEEGISKLMAVRLADVEQAAEAA
ncbi:MAG TPA: chromosome segregation protein SMC [Candidatus Methylomirabilis sp.]|jgi:chromosome segregation protein